MQGLIPYFRRNNGLKAVHCLCNLRHAGRSESDSSTLGTGLFEISIIVFM